MLSADILLKGLGGLAVVGGATTVGVCYKQEKWIFAKKKVETLTLEKLAEKVGLVCNGTPTATAGVVCSKKTDANVKVKVKKDNETFDVSNLLATGGSGGKLKVYKTSAGETYNNDFKFVVEEADISGENSKKLDEFETYEIKEADDKTWYLTKKTDINAGIKKALGLPDDSKCDLPTNTTDEKTCDLDDAKFKKIKFEGGDDSKSVTGAPKLKISKVEDSNNDYGEKYKFKFVLESAQDATISKTVTIKKGTNTEFKIKKDTSTKTLSLEKAWTLDELVKKVGITTCAANGGTAKECSFSASTKVNLFNDSGNYAKQATVSSSDTSKKIKVEENQENHSQGFKFYAEESSEITVENGTPNAGSDKKITKKGDNNSPTYEIKEQTPSEAGGKDWYLSKVTNPPGGGA